MTAKENFVKAFQDKTNQHPKEFNDKEKVGEFVNILNNDSSLKNLFRDAVQEAKDEDGDTTGLGLLFQGT